MNSGFCFAANDASEKLVAVTDSYAGKIVLVPIMGKSILYHRTQVAPVKNICNAITTGLAIEMPSVPDQEVNDMLTHIIADSRINNAVKSFLFPELKEALDLERKR